MDVNSILIFTAITLAGVLLLVLLFSGVQARKDKRVHEANMAKAAAIAAREAARGHAEASVAAAREAEAVKVKIGLVMVLGAAVLSFWLFVSFRSWVSEWGKVSRYGARQSAIVELDMGRTIRHGYTMEMIGTKAWADAYAKTGGSGSASGVSWAWVLLGGAFAFFLGVNVYGRMKMGVWPLADMVRGPPR